MEKQEIKKAAYLEKYSGVDNRLLTRRETVLTVEQIREAIRTIWPDRAETYDPNGSVVIRVWDNAGLKQAGVIPEYLFIFKPLR